MRTNPVVPDTPEARFTRLFEANYEQVRAYALRRVAPDLAADVVQETFLVAWRRPDEVPSHALPWLLAVARRIVLRQWRSAARREALLVLVASAPAVARPTADEQDARVVAAVERLSPNDRDLLGLIYWDGLTPAEAATVVGCSQTALRVRLHRARRRLVLALEAEPPQLTSIHPLHLEEAL